MLTYSQWQPDGGYDYYETQQTAPLGDDLSTPRLGVVNGLGVPSTEAGRPIPAGAVYVGEGDVPVGVVAPMDTSRLGAVSFLSEVSPWVAFMSGAAVVGVIWLVWGREKP